MTSTVTYKLLPTGTKRDLSRRARAAYNAWTEVLDALGPDVGRCPWCRFDDARHRAAEVITTRVLDGDSCVDIADDYGLDAEQVLVVASRTFAMRELADDLWLLRRYFGPRARCIQAPQEPQEPRQARRAPDLVSTDA